MNKETKEELKKKVVPDIPKKEPHPLAGVEIFGVNDARAGTQSNAAYIYTLLDDKDKKLLTILKLPHIRSKVITETGMIDPVKMDTLIEWENPSVDLTIKRIRNLCAYGAIVSDQKVGWVTNPKLSSIVTSRHNR